VTVTAVHYTRRLIEHRLGHPIDALRHDPRHRDDPVLPLIWRRLDTAETAAAEADAIAEAPASTVGGLLQQATALAELDQRQQTHTEAIWDLLDVHLRLTPTPRTTDRPAEQPDDAELLSAARHATAGLPTRTRLTRDTLRRALRAHGIHASNQRLSHVLHHLKAEQHR
jgi:hypothetical protein